MLPKEDQWRKDNCASHGGKALHHVAAIDGKGPCLKPWEMGLGSISGSVANTCSSKSKPKELKEQEQQCEAKKNPQKYSSYCGDKKKTTQEGDKWLEVKKKKSNLNNNKEFAWETLNGTKYLYLCTGCQNGSHVCRPIDRGNTILDHELWETCDSVKRNSLLLNEFQIKEVKRCKFLLRTPLFS